jgi:hypothetical protein
MIQIISKEDGFRRCGVAHSKTATEYRDGRFTAEQLEILQAEPMLVVQVIEDEGGEGGKNYPMNAKNTVKAIQAAVSADRVAELTQGDDRTSVVAAADKRIKELAA